MSDYTPKAGDRVRVVLEGEVTSTINEWFALQGVGFFRTDGRDVVSVERLPDPEPDRIGDCYIDANGVVTVIDVYEARYATDPEATPTPPFTLLVRDGKQVRP